MLDKENKREYNRLWNQRNPEKVAAQRKRYKTKHKDKVREKNNEWRAANQDRCRGYTRKWADKNAERERNRSRLKNWKWKGLPEPKTEMPDECESCGKSRGEKALALDHCHTTGEFRGWLCFFCNSGLGFLGDTEEGVLRILAYLRKPRP